MTTLLQDFRHGFRMLRRSPGFTMVAVATLAVGIAANTAVFSWIETVLLTPVPGVADSNRLVSFESTTVNGEFIPNSYPDYRDYRDHLTLLSGLAMATPHALSVGDEDHAERVWGELVSGNYFAVLGVKPILGRTFSPDEYGDTQGGYPVAVIGENLWNRRFQRDRGVLGRTIQVNRQQLTIIGVVSEQFRGSLSGLSFELWTPVVMAPQLNAMPDWMLSERKSRLLFGVARLKPGVSAPQAAAEARALSVQLARDNPDTNKGIGGSILPLSESHFGAQRTLGASLRILMGVCGVLLLIVCANVGNLLLARATSRQKEYGLRLALGAGRWRIARQLFIENLVLAAAAAVAGAPLAMWMSHALSYLVPQSGLPVALDVAMNGDVLVFTILLCVVASVASGIAPAVQIARIDLNSTLKDGGRGSAGARSQRIRSLLVISEVAMALVAIIGAGLFARSFQLARQIDPGFNPHGVLVSQLYLSTAGYTVPKRIEFCARLREQLESQPGITAVSYADYIPLGFADGSWEDLNVEGHLPDPTENMKIYRTVVAPGYFDVMRIPLLTGRDFTERDDPKSQPVMIVNQRFVKRFYGDANPIGRRVYGWGKWFTIVGLVKDTKYHKPNEDQRALFYVPFRQVYREELGIAFYARTTTADPSTAVAVMQREVRRIDPSVGVFDATPLSEYITASLFAQKIAASLLGILGALALGLAAVGLYSVMAYSIAQRTQEIGIRMALGAKSGDVLALVVRQAMGIVLAGIAVGVAVASALTRAAAGLLINVSATDPTIFASAAAFLAVVGLIAACVPALRAARIDPNVALRRL